MIYFDKLFALKAKYKEALDEDARKRQQIEKNFADGWITESYRKKALEDQEAALEYCRKATLEAAEAVKAEASAMLDCWDMPNAAKLPANAAFLAGNSPVTLTQEEMQKFVNENRYGSLSAAARKTSSCSSVRMFIALWGTLGGFTCLAGLLGISPWSAAAWRAWWRTAWMPWTVVGERPRL